jgi:hypothetical protein
VPQVDPRTMDVSSLWSERELHLTTLACSIKGAYSSMKMTWLQNGLNEVLRRRGKEIVQSDRLYEWQRDNPLRPGYCRVDLPPETSNYLRSDNPKLLDLKLRYSAFDSNVTTPLVWNEGHLKVEDIPHFRGDNAYVWQVRGQNMNIVGYSLAYYYLKSIDRLNLFDRMNEDGAFGNLTFRVGDRDVSRDLLDSIAEIYFLERHLELSRSTTISILDIGAGYGRLAHRAVLAWPNLENYFCTDAIPHSTFISDFYLRHRGVERTARVVALDEIQAIVASRRIDVAVNIHSFSECPPAAIDWWISLIAKNGVKHLMVVPNSTDAGGERLFANDQSDFRPLIEKHGYGLLVAQAKYLDPLVQQYALQPATHFLFALK